MNNHLFRVIFISVGLFFGFMVNAQTTCPVLPAPFNESFDNAILPSCWESLSSDPSVSPDNYWKFNDQGDYGAANNGKTAGEFVKADGSNPNPDSMMLVSPEINLSPLTTPYLSFEWFSNNTDFPGDNNPLIVDIFDGLTWLNLDTLMGDSSEWRFQNYDLSAFMNDTVRIRFMVNQTLTSNHPIYNDILLDEVRIDNCVSTTGQDGSIDVCQNNPLVNLDNIIVKPNGGGTWHYPPSPSSIIQNKYIHVGGFSPGSTHEVYYVERLVCYDTTVATITIYDYNSAGIGDTTAQACAGEPVPLFNYLSGYVSLGGTWYDFTYTELNSSLITTPSIPGIYEHYYVVENTECANDTAVVKLEAMDCGWGPGVGVDKNNFEQISVAPNPAKNFINIKNTSAITGLKIQVIDLNGRVVLTENKSLSQQTANIKLAIHQLEKGVYYLKVFNRENQKVYKIVKQ